VFGEHAFSWREALQVTRLKEVFGEHAFSWREERSSTGDSGLFVYAAAPELPSSQGNLRTTYL